ncbi:MAG: 3'-5' exonuclease [Pegethrix bostrychoides GSE-TBD4-15B]|uniref:3'-5' exonuclease n=1 Tax=Pegethrix bostrychoides GSE-TBD4-15B TaxID=2839662 RepID=A0A951PFR6_9CYAN|nr:3'-5' exonuclease [Pegethrix bostrychoides GSE-TBD4-15B]
MTSSNQLYPLPFLKTAVRSTELLLHYRRLSQQLITVVDVETTGLYAWDSRITEISVIHATLADGVKHQQTDLVNSQTRVPAKITQFTGITQSMVDSATPAAELYPHYLPLLEQGILTAHNLEFDYPFLQAEYARLGTKFLRPEPDQLCTVKLARLMLPDLRSRSLPNLVQHFQFPVGESHRAEADTLACWLLAERLLTELLNEPDAALLARFGRQWISLREAAGILNCPQVAARTQLDDAGAASRFVGKGRGGTWMYRRGEVERLLRG